MYSPSEIYLKLKFSKITFASNIHVRWRIIPAQSTEHDIIISLDYANFQKDPLTDKRFRQMSLLKDIINKGSVPDSSSTNYPMGAFLSDILFSFVLEKYVVCNVCGFRYPSFESSSVLYITPTDTSSMQDLILQGMQQKLQQSCCRCNKNIMHVESNCILQPPKYLLLSVNLLRYINNNVTKDRCPIPMDTIVMLVPLNLVYGLL